MAERVRPDVVVMDLSMPGEGGLAATRRITALGIGARVLVLTVHAETEYLMPVLEAGGSGYVTKHSADRELVQAHVNALRERFSANRIDYTLLNTASPLDHALFSYLSTRERLSRVR